MEHDKFQMLKELADVAKQERDKFYEAAWAYDAARLKNPDTGLPELYTAREVAWSSFQLSHAQLGTYVVDHLELFTCDDDPR